MADGEGDPGYGLVTPFWIDTEAYSDRDRLMFCCGVEFEMVRREIESGGPIDRAVHKENESRLRMLCGRSGLPCQITDLGDGTWSRLEAK